MKKQNENGRISEDRLSRANKRKKNNTIASILVREFCIPGSTASSGAMPTIWRQQRKPEARRKRAHRKW